MAARRQERFSVILSAVDKVSAPIRRINRRIESMVAPVRKVARAFKSLIREAGFGKLAAGVKRLGATFARLGIGAVAALGGLFVALKRTAESLDEIGKITARLNFPVEQFQAWRIEAQIAGSTGEEFDKSIQKLAKNIGDLKAGSGELLTQLQRTDPQLLAQIGAVTDTEEAFTLLLNAIRKQPDAFQKMSLANAAFGRAGKSLINLTGKSNEELDRAIAEHLKFSVASAGSIKAAELFNDTMLLMKNTIGAVWTEIAGKLFPIMTDIAEKTRVWAGENKKAIVEGFVAFLKNTKEALVPVVEFLKKVIPPTIEIIKRFGGMKLVLGVIAAVVLFPLVAAIAAVGAALFSTAGLVIGVVAAIAGVTAFLVSNWGTISTVVLSLVDSIKASFQDLVDFFSPMIDTMVTQFKRLTDLIPQPLIDFLTKGAAGFSGSLATAATSLFPEAARPSFLPAVPDNSAFLREAQAAIAGPDNREPSKSELVVRIEEGRVKSAEIVSGSDVVLAEGGLVGSAF